MASAQERPRGQRDQPGRKLGHGLALLSGYGPARPPADGRWKRAIAAPCEPCTVTPYDDLLLWASEKQCGNLGRAARSCAWTAGPWNHRAGPDVFDDLLALGHVDAALGAGSSLPRA